MDDASLQPILALIGHPLGGNPTQYMTEKAFAHHHLDWRYLSLEVLPENLGDAIRGIRAMGFRGGNCARPHKIAVTEYLDRLDRTAQLVGAVNVLVQVDEELIGQNTEGQAVLAGIRRRLEPAARRIVILGAGKLGRAVGIELALAGVAGIEIVCRNEEAGQGLATRIEDELKVPTSSVAWRHDYTPPEDTDILIQATSIDPNDPIPPVLDTLIGGSLVVDVTTNPPRTPLIRQAIEQGFVTLDGLEIFIDQASINFKLWTGIEPDTRIISEAVEEYLEL